VICTIILISKPKVQNNQAENHIDYRLLSIVLFFIIIVLVGIIFYLSISKSSPEKADITPNGNNLGLSTLAPPPSSPTPTLAPESVTYPLQGNEYIFQLKGDSGSPVAEITYLISEYELTNQVVLNKLYKALVSNDTEILVLHVEITNNTGLAFEIMSGDYLRMTKNNDIKRIAPDIDDDPIEVRPHSTASTSLGFTISKSDTNIQIQVGESGVEIDTIPIQYPAN